ncbi:hypothetical protein I6J77_02765 [Rhodanobacter sp. FDAARGOS 1247]|uniref:hypothetical protein n=1 Tax=Rhodanobacter sp. FDAARGOS 1247 TaxID=2778082 RepID=UPI0019529008|nr:hypothetical protein [Rhodanobacter sp. FDAARGOS 1247]QRP64402.1 hypothetical protein I6J77_02765 [Rhodanobacter sp. FDAARGOS 1247]
MKTLSEELAGKVMPVLVEQGLFLPEDAQRYEAKLASGKMKAEDWRLIAEKAAAKEVSL